LKQVLKVTSLIGKVNMSDRALWTLSDVYIIVTAEKSHVL